MYNTQLVFLEKNLTGLEEDYSLLFVHKINSGLHLTHWKNLASGKIIPPAPAGPLQQQHCYGADLF